MIKNNKYDIVMKNFFNLSSVLATALMMTVVNG